MKVSFLKTAELVSWLHCRPRSPRGSILSTCTRVQSRSTLCDPVDCSPHRRLCPWDFPGKNTGMGCHFLLQGNFWTQGLNLRFPQALIWVCVHSPSVGQVTAPGASVSLSGNEKPPHHPPGEAAVAAPLAAHTQEGFSTQGRCL